MKFCARLSVVDSVDATFSILRDREELVTVSTGG